ncbi:MAG: hypothetical protein IPG22_13840 [Acidobacteria bacterium]|nr:hypothetical protein [Acidobacteriota bacterium]
MTNHNSKGEKHGKLFDFAILSHGYALVTVAAHLEGRASAVNVAWFPHCFQLSLPQHQ